MKNKFDAPELELSVFSAEDVVNASAGLTGESSGSGEQDSFDNLFGKN